MMTLAQQNSIYQEYCQFMQPTPQQPTEQTLRDNLAKAQHEHRQRTLESGRHFIDCRHKEYDRKLADIALGQCKSKKEWQDMEADDQRMMSTGVMTHKSAQELLDRYIDKINRSYQAEHWYMSEIRKCEQEIAKIEQSNESARRKHNKLVHWQTRQQNYLVKLHVQTIKTDRFECLVTKWRGICEKIRIADIAREITAERLGVDNKYGFNPNMQDRETATGIFTDD